MVAHVGAFGSRSLSNEQAVCAKTIRSAGAIERFLSFKATSVKCYFNVSFPNLHKLFIATVLFYNMLPAGHTDMGFSLRCNSLNCVVCAAAYGNAK